MKAYRFGMTTMKANRFGMSQKIFCDMFVQWFNTQTYVAQAHRFNGAKEKALKVLDEAEEVAAKTFRDGEPNEMVVHRATISRLREEIILELSDLEEVSDLSS